MKTTEWYSEADAEGKLTLLKQASQLWQSYLMVRNGEKEIYGDLLEHLKKQYALGTDQFPKTITKAADVMGAHEIQKDQGKLKKEKNEKNTEKEKNKNENNNQPNRPRRNGNGNGNGNEMNFRQNRETFCHVCGDKSHMAPKCKLKNKVAYDDWYISELKRAKIQQQHQQNLQKTDAKKIKEKVQENMEKGWCTFQTEEYSGICKSESDSEQQSVVNNGMELNQHPSNKFGFLKNSLILDTGSTISATVMNEDMVINIDKAKVPIVMTTNA